MRKLVLISFASQLLGFLFYYLASFLLVRILEQDDFGIVQQFNLLLATLVPFTGLTLVSSLYYFYPLEDDAGKSRLVLQTLFLLVLAGVLSWIVFLWNKEAMLRLMQLESFTAFPDYIFLSVPLYLVSSISDNLFLLDKKQAVMLLYLPLEKLLFLVAILVCYRLTHSIEGILSGILLYSVVKTLFVLAYVQRLHGFGSLRIRFSPIARQLAYCIPFYVANVVYIISIKFDKFYINSFVTPEAYAVYSVAFISIPLLANAFNAINSVAMSEITALLGRNDMAGVVALYRKMVSKSTALALPCMVFFCINSREIIVFLFTEAYVTATPYYQIYLLTFLISLTSYGLILRASGSTSTIFVINFFSAVVTLAAGFLLIPVYGMTGAIITAVIAIVLPGIVQLAAEVRLTGYSFTRFFPLRDFGKTGLIALAFSPVVLLIKWLDLSAFLTIALSGLVYFTGTVWLLYRFGSFPFAQTLEKATGRARSLFTKNPPL